MVTNQSLNGQGPADAGALIGQSDVFLITVIVVGSILFVVIIVIIAVMISSLVKKKKSTESENSFKSYAPGSAKRHYLSTPESKNYLLRKYKCVPYMIGSPTQHKVPLRKMNPLYEGHTLDPCLSLHQPPASNDKSVLVANGGSPVDSLAVPPVHSITARSITSDLLDQLKEFQHMRRIEDSPL